MTTTNRSEYQDLVSARKACTLCAPMLTNLAVCKGGIYDSNEIGGWSQWQGNRSQPKLMVVGQDWGDRACAIQNNGHEPPANPTNETLIRLLASIDLRIEPPTRSDCGGGPLFFTNAILCLKEGGLQGRVNPAWFANCAPFLERTVEVVRPKVIVTLGERAYKVMRQLYPLPRWRFRRAVDHEAGFTLEGGVQYFPMYHCGARILNTHRPLDRQFQDWSRVGRWLARRQPV